MYPKPVQHKLDWMKIITDAAKEGMQIFNQVKGMLPEGTLSNLKIPGLPEGMGANIEKGVKMFEQGKEMFEKFGGAELLNGGGQMQDEFMDFEEDLIENLGGESNKAFAERVALRKSYVDTCNRGKAEFAQGIATLSSGLKKAASDNAGIGQRAIEAIDDNLMAKMAEYKKQVYAVVETDESMLGSSESHMQEMYNAAQSAHSSNMKAVHDAKRQGLINKAMLLQTGQ